MKKENGLNLKCDLFDSSIHEKREISGKPSLVCDSAYCISVYFALQIREQKFYITYRDLKLSEECGDNLKIINLIDGCDDTYSDDEVAEIRDFVEHKIKSEAERESDFLIAEANLREAEEALEEAKKRWKKQEENKAFLEEAEEGLEKAKKAVEEAEEGFE